MRRSGFLALVACLAAMIAAVVAGPAGANQTDQQIAAFCANLKPDDLGARRACIDEQRIAARQVFEWARKTNENPDARQLHAACARASGLLTGGYDWPAQHACIGAELAALDKLIEQRVGAKEDNFTAKLITLCTAKQSTQAADGYRRLVQCLFVQRKAGEKVSEMYQFFKPLSPERDIVNRCAERLRGPENTYDWPKVKGCIDTELQASAVLSK